MTPKITKEEFLVETNQAYVEWQSALAKIDPQAMEIPIETNGWTVKDVIAHITWHEREMIGVLTARALVGSELWEQPLNVRNAAIYELYKGQPLEKIQKEAEQVHSELIFLLESLTTEELNNANLFDEMPLDWAPWDVFSSNTYKHYRDHTKDVVNWFAD